MKLVKLLEKKGFSLIELMVVVAIIGILAAVAVPQYRTYQAKSKTSEAKLMLSSVYTAETAFYSDYDTYAACLLDMGISAPNAGYYVFGFSADNTTLNGTATGAICNAAQHQVVPGTPKATGGVAAAAADIDAVVVAANAFTARAVGVIAIGGGNTADRWDINESKTITHVMKGF